MKHNAIAAVLVVSAALLASGCNKEEEIAKRTGTLPQEKISRIYTTTHIVYETLNPVTGTWTVLMDITNGRSPLCEFTWSGDRIGKMKSGDDTYIFKYDKFGRLILVECTDNVDRHYEFTYNSDGLLARSSAVLKASSGELESSRTIDYTWAGSRLQKAEEKMLAPREDDGEFISESTHVYEWDNDNVSSTRRNTLNNDGSFELFNYDYEYTPIPNPLRGFVLCQECYFGLVWSFEGIDGLSLNMLSHVVSDNADITYEYTVSGDRVSTIKKNYVALDGGSTRMTTETFYEFEYED